jgi:hypothetical protein
MLSTGCYAIRMEGGLESRAPYSMCLLILAVCDPTLKSPPLPTETPNQRHQLAPRKRRTLQKKKNIDIILRTLYFAYR